MSSMFGGWVSYVVGGLGALVLVALAAFLGIFILPRFWKRVLDARWWGFWIAFVVGFVIVLFRDFRPAPSSLPSLFRTGYRFWLYLLAAGFIAAMMKVIESLVRHWYVPGEESPDEVADGAQTGFEAAWSEIRLRLEDKGIRLETQRIFLLLAPSSEWCKALIDAAGTRLVASVPDSGAAFIAHATDDGVLFDCSGISRFGSRSNAGTSDLEKLAERLRDLNPDRQRLVSVVILFPIPWLQEPQAAGQATLFRDDLKSIRSAFLVNPHIHLVVSGLESLPGMTEFARRIETSMGLKDTKQRIGFDVPASPGFSGQIAKEGLSYISSWFDRWALFLINTDPADSDGNGRLYMLARELRELRSKLVRVFESAFLAPRGQAPVLLRDCHFVATGSGGKNARAFAEKLLGGSGGRLLRHAGGAAWSVEALEEDARYRAIAKRIGIVGCGVSLLALLYAMTLHDVLWGLLVPAIGLVWYGVIRRQVGGNSSRATTRTSPRTSPSDEFGPPSGPRPPGSRFPR